MPSTSTAQVRPALFLDRDGVINRNLGYVGTPDRVEFLPGVAAGLSRIRDLGFLIVVVTNQSGVARGMFDEADVRALHEWMSDELARHGAAIDRFYFCPHHPTEGAPPFRQNCDCRKPRPGMIEQAARELTIDLSHSAIAGDEMHDLEAGRAAGVATRILIGSTRSAPAGLVTTACANLNELALFLERRPVDAVG